MDQMNSFHMKKNNGKVLIEYIKENVTLMLAFYIEADNFCIDVK
ncbi:unnamed protein product, partial [Rotaria sp. Silwood2]